MSSKEDHLGHQKNVIVHLFCVTVAGVTVGCRKISIYRQFPSKGCKASNSPIQTFCHPVKMRGKRNGARVLQIQNWFQESQVGRQCKGRQPRNFDFLQLTHIARSFFLEFQWYTSPSALCHVAKANQGNSLNNS